MTTEITNEQLSTIFTTAMNKYGTYDNVTANFIQHSDLKITWERTLRSADFHISDYLSNAPIDVLEDLADTLSRKIMGDDATYTNAVVNYLNSAEFRATNQSLFFARHEMDGDERLDRLAQELVEEGHVESIEGVKFGFRKCNPRYYGASSVLMKVVGVNKDLKNASDGVLKYALLTQIGFISQEFSYHGAANPREAVEKMVERYTMDGKTIRELQSYRMSM